jgi:hypothetical protein
MQITIETNELSEFDKTILLAVLGGDAPAAAAPVAKKAAAAPAKKAAAAKPEPTPEPEAEAPAEEASSDDAEPTLEDAVALATKLVQGGKSAEVKAALGEVGAKRVSEVGEDKIADLMGLLNDI